jgi:hypothetical protein
MPAYDITATKLLPEYKERITPPRATTTLKVVQGDLDVPDENANMVAVSTRD